MAKTRFLKYDIMRALAITFVIILHVSAYIVIYYPDANSAEFIAGNLFNGLVRSCVPLFAVLSGALLLNEDKKIEAKTFYKKSFSHIAFLLVFWLIVYAFWYAVPFQLLLGNEISMDNFVGYLFTYSVGDYNHLWYLFMAVGIYLMIPVLRLFVKRENKNYILGIIAASFMVQFIPQTTNMFTVNAANTVSGFVGRFYLTPAAGIIGLLLIGWYLNEYTLKKSHRFILYALGFVSAVGSTLAVQLLITDIGGAARTYFYGIATAPMALYAAATFELIAQICKNKETKSKLLSMYSRLSFGIYIIHIAFLEVLTRVILPYSGSGALDTCIYIVLMTMVTIAISFAVCLAASKTKIGRKLLHIQ